MSDLLAAVYPWAKALHIMAVISWMAALFYLPRLLVHHTEQVGLQGPTHELFSMMEFQACHDNHAAGYDRHLDFWAKLGFYTRRRRLDGLVAMDQRDQRDRDDSVP